MDKDRINEKVIYLNELIYELKELSMISKKDFLMNRYYIGTAENDLRKALQVVIDLADDLVSKNRLRSL